MEKGYSWNLINHKAANKKEAYDFYSHLIYFGDFLNSILHVCNSKLSIVQY